jgi:hypothetical protein
MTDLVKVAIITGIFTSLPSVVGTIATWRKLHTVGKEMNGMKDQLVKSTGDAAFAAGRKEEKENPT